jgi:dihydrofolate synthase/folylpolyglutamate synthase
VDPLISTITGIELEHTDYLGNTLSAIAGEKAGIIKKSKPLALAEQAPEALEVFRRKAAEKDAPLYYFPDYVHVENTKVHREGTDFTLVFREKGFFETPLELFIPIPGTVQAANAGLAVLSLKIAYPSITIEAIRRGLGGFKLPARFERISDNPPLVIDGAHTARSVELVVHTFTDLYGTGGVCLFGCGADKNAEAMARIVLPCFSFIIITTPGSFKISYPEAVYEIFKKEAALLPETNREHPLPDVCFIRETDRAIDRAVTLGREQSMPVLGTGSNYLAAEIRKGYV